MVSAARSPWPCFSQEEADAVSKVLLSNKVNYWTGTECREFEKEFAAFSGTRHAIALANGTVALDLALQGLGIGAHYGGKSTDEVIVTPRSFIASVSSIVNAGARPVFADIDRDSQNITATSVKAVLTKNTRAVICVHLAGWPCDMDEIRATVGHDVKLIEDCAQAHGAKFKGKPVGGLGDVAAWSFCQDKIMTTGGEGGMVTCDDEALWRKMWAFKDHGKSYEAVYEREHKPGFRWLHESFGTNWRLTEMQAVIGRIQLTKMPDWHAARKKNANILNKSLEPFRDLLRIPQLEHKDRNGFDDVSGTSHAWYKYYVFVRPDKLRSGWNRDRIVAEVSQEGIPCMQGSCSEIYLERAFEKTDFVPTKRLPIARELGETSLMLLVHPTLSEEELGYATNVLTNVLSNAKP